MHLNRKKKLQYRWKMPGRNHTTNNRNTIQKQLGEFIPFNLNPTIIWTWNQFSNAKLIMARQITMWNLQTTRRALDSPMWANKEMLGQFTLIGMKNAATTFKSTLHNLHVTVWKVIL